MPSLHRLSTCSAFALAMAAGPAAADLTAQQVWDGLEAAMQDFGYSVEATENPAEDGLTVRDVTMRFDMPEDDGTVSFTLDEITFTENSDGSVAMSYPASMPITVDAAPEDGEAVKMMLNLTQSGLSIVASGSPDAMTYTYDADMLSLALEELEVDGETLGRDDASFTLALNGLDGVSTIEKDGATLMNQDLRARTARYDFAFADLESEGRAKVSGSMENLTTESTSYLPEGFDSADPQSFATGGFSASGRLGYENGRTEFTVTEENGETTGNTATASVELVFEMNGETLGYSVSAKDQKADVNGPDMPVPVSFSMSESAFNFTVPIAAATEPQEMAFGLTLAGFEMSEELWALFDRGGALPRDPATIAIDVTGKVTPFVNLFDPEEMEKIEETGAAPGELNALTLNDLTIELAGASLGGTGSFTFDNDDLKSFDGFPRPEGAVNLTLEGANALIDQLIGMGVLTQEDAMGARMMINMFAVPGDDPDTLTSSIQVNEQGHVLANGMRIR
ncbi:DUF2125 domain-containing protein [Marivita sp. GX14005]|uniref:DUF2125 domain-containing protein n=1 Tax=Marivita sp. GX14005 TaxID=2942276 RepID=UPI002019A04A|nr:DUF2125 domain-containing protein [Marivita sp. GX14005]MCL3882001.1 DUF2125 domain-containing protein [Marivita sp. GX14005]